jgi:cyclin L
VAAAALYLVTKPGPYPLSPRQVLNAFYYVTHVSNSQSRNANNQDSTDIPLYSEGQLEADRGALVKIESRILQVLGFQTHVALPHGLCINYLQTMDVFGEESGQDLARRAWCHLNSALLSPQLIYLTHQPNALAAAAIYLGAREVDFNLPTEPWWEVFDVDREELGFLVVAMTSQSGFMDSEAAKYERGGPPLTSTLLKEELQKLS